MPTIFDLEKSHLSPESKYLKSPVSVPRKLPTKRVYQQDQFKLFEEQDKIKRFDDTDSTLTPSGYTFQKHYNHVVFYRLEINVLSVPEGTVNTWWDISNSKVQFSNHNLGNVAKQDDGSQNFVMKIGVMRGSHLLNNSLSPCQLPRL